MVYRYSTLSHSTAQTTDRLHFIYYTFLYNSSTPIVLQTLVPCRLASVSGWAQLSLVRSCSFVISEKFHTNILLFWKWKCTLCCKTKMVKVHFPVIFLTPHVYWIALMIYFSVTAWKIDQKRAMGDIIDMELFFGRNQKHRSCKIFSS